MKHIDISSIWSESFNKNVLLGSLMFEKIPGKRYYISFDKLNELSNFQRDSSFGRLVSKLDQKNTYFIQPISPYSAELTMNKIMVEVILKGKLDYGGEVVYNKELIEELRGADHPIVANGRKTLLFYKKVILLSDEYSSILFNSYTYTLGSILSGMIVDFSNKVICTFYDGGINVYVTESNGTDDSITIIEGLEKYDQ